MQPVTVIEGEKWCDVDGYSGYSISDLGRVASRWKSQGHGRGVWCEKVLDDTPRLLKQKFKGEHYHRVLLYKNGKRKLWMVHILVLEHFGPPKPFETAHALHRDDNPDNNCIDNLYWGTPKDNKADAIRNERGGGPLPGEKHHNAKLKDADIPVIKKRLEAGETCQTIAGDYGVNRTVINHIKLGQAHQHDTTEFVNPGRVSYRVTGDAHFNSKASRMKKNGDGLLYTKEK